MEELTEVITATEFHPFHCNLFIYSSSKSSIKLADMRDSALCDKYAKCTLALLPQSSSVRLMSIHRLWRGRRSNDTVILLRNHFFHLRCKVQLRWTIYLISWLSFIEDLGCQHGIKTHQDNSHSWPPAGKTLWSLWEWLYLWQIRVRMGWRRQVRDRGSFYSFYVSHFARTSFNQELHQMDSERRSPLLINGITWNGKSWADQSFSFFDRHVLTGSYHNFFRIYDTDTLNDVVLQADKSAFKAKKIGGPLPGNKIMRNGPKGAFRDAMQLDALDFNKKILHASWHPRENTIAVISSFRVLILASVQADAFFC